MTDRQFWDKLDRLGPEEVRRGLAQFRWYGPGTRESEAREWLAHYESTSASAARAAIRGLAEEANALALAANVEADRANELARAANEQAEAANSLAERANALAEQAASSAALTARATDELARRANTNNMIATLALIAAVIAIAISIFGMFIKR